MIYKYYINTGQFINLSITICSEVYTLFQKSHLSGKSRFFKNHNFCQKTTLFWTNPGFSKITTFSKKSHLLDKSRFFKKSQLLSKITTFQKITLFSKITTFVKNHDFSEIITFVKNHSFCQNHNFCQKIEKLNETYLKSKFDWNSMSHSKERRNNVR